MSGLISLFLSFTLNTLSYTTILPNLRHHVGILDSKGSLRREGVRKAEAFPGAPSRLMSSRHWPERSNTTREAGKSHS